MPWWGKYVWHEDSYKSVDESLIHAAMKNNVQLKLNKIPSESLHSFAETSKILAGAGGILIPGGFGVRGVEGMLNAICYARKMNIPFLGICLGMQLQVVEWSRNIIGIEDAHSGEFVCGEGTKVVDLLERTKKCKGLWCHNVSGEQGITGTGGYSGFFCLWQPFDFRMP